MQKFVISVKEKITGRDVIPPYVVNSLEGAYSNRIRFIIKTGIEYETKKNYESLRDVFNIRSANPDISDCMFALPANGQERDVLSNVSCETVQLLEQLRYRSATFCRDMIKHKKLNDANNIFNRMV